MEKNKSVYLFTVVGAVCMVLLRICGDAGIFPLALAIAGVTAFVYSVRCACLKKEYIIVAGVMAVTYAVRFYGYTGGPAADIVLGLLTGLIVFALMALECPAKKYKDRFWYTLIFPAGYLLFMYFTEMVKINMPFRLDIYLSRVPVLCQITALLGIYFLDFLLTWTASALAFLIDHRRSRQSGILAAVWALTMCAVVCFGGVHLRQMNTQEGAKTDTVRVALATGPYYGSFSDASYLRFTMDDTMASLAGIVQEAAEQNAEILMFCEEAYCVYDKDEDLLIKEAEQMAAENDIHLLLAYEVDDTDESEDGKAINKLCWISNEGQILYDYTKHCIIPFIETSGYVRGSKNIEAFEISVHGKSLKAAAAICYDADFDLFMSHMGENVDLLFLPTWDWDVIAEKHFSVARLRAISEQTTLVRSVYDGWNAVIDSAGNVLWRDNTNETGYENVLVYDVPVR